MGNIVCGSIFDHHLLVGDEGVRPEGCDDLGAHLRLIVVGLGKDAAVAGCAAADFRRVEVAGLDILDILCLAHSPGIDSPGTLVGQEYTVVRILFLVAEDAVRIDEGEDFIAVGEAFHGYQHTPQVSCESRAYACLDFRFANDSRADRRAVFPAEDMAVDDGLGIDVRRLVFVRSGIVGLQSELRHAVVGAHAEVSAFYINPLSQLVVAVERRLAEFEVDASGFVLDVNLTVEIAGLVVGNDLSLDPDIVENRMSGSLFLLVGRLLVVLVLHILYGGEGTGESVLRELGFGPDLHLGGFIVAESEYGLPFFFQTLAGNEGGCSRDCEDDLFHTLRI